MGFVYNICHMTLFKCEKKKKDPILFEVNEVGYKKKVYKKDAKNFQLLFVLRGSYSKG